jgi:hypothetical protein
MRWYVSKNGETTGPVEEAQIVEWVKAGLRDAMVRDEAGGQWTALTQSPFAPPGPVAVASGSEALGTLIVLAPLLSTALVWGWVGSMNLFQDPAGSLFVLSLITIVGTSALVAAEASLLGMGKRPGSNGKNESGPVGWFIACALLWFLAFPWYLHKRRFFGRRSLALAGLLFGGMFLFSTFSMGAAIEAKKAQIRRDLGAFGTRLQ